MDARYLLDTNTIIYILRQTPLSVRAAFSKLQQGEAAMGILEEMMQILPLTTLRCGGGVWRDSGRARAQGKPIGNNDLWIAAHALAAGLILVTNNEREYRRVRGLKVQNWVR